MPEDPTFAEQMVSKLETVLLESAGLKTVSVSGTVTTFDDVQRQYEFWKSKVAREQGRKPRLVRVDLSGF